MTTYDFDFKAARDALAEYEGQEAVEERRGPTQRHEFHEPVGWSNRVKDIRKKPMRIYLETSKDDLYRTRGVGIHKEQMRWHDENDIAVTEAEFVCYPDGTEEVAYFTYLATTILGKEAVDKMISELVVNTKTFNNHYPPETSEEDIRFKENYVADRARALANS